MRKRIVLSALLISLFTTAGAQTAASAAADAASKEDVQRLFNVMSSKDQIRHMMEQMFAQMKALNREQMKKRWTRSKLRSTGRRNP